MNLRAASALCVGLFLAACSGSNLEIAPGADTSTTGDGAASDTSGADASGGDSVGTDTSGGDDAIASDGTAGDGISSDVIASDGKPDGPLCDRSTFPTFIKGCTNDESCSFGLHALDCCGSMTAIGFNHSEKTRFDAAEKVYEAACPIACGCPAGPITTDSGLTTTDPSKIVVQCVPLATGAGECRTTVK